MIIKILGSGCKSCCALTDNVKKAISDLSIESEIIKVTDFVEISKFNVMKTPALVVNDKLVSFGRVNDVEEIKKFLEV